MTPSPTPKRPRAPRVKAPLALPTATLTRVTEYVTGSVPDRHKVATERALLGQLSRANAIKVKCLQCCCYAREEIKLCTVTTCALHPVRPYN